MSERVVKTCDRCGKQLDLYATLGWQFVKFESAAEGAPNLVPPTIQYDVCAECASDLKQVFFKYQESQ